MDKTIEERLRKGVRQFFAALEMVYKNDKAKDATKLNILLAGNSSKSTVLRRVFDEVIQQKTAELELGYCPFEIFPPLGTAEADAVLAERGQVPQRGDLERPTGKTGVAFGLLKCRKGGRIERISHVRIDDALPFAFYLGTERKGKFVPMQGEGFAEIGRPELNVWVDFGPVVEDIFELYYTALTECVVEPLSIAGNPDIHKEPCPLEDAYEGARIYLCASDSRTLEYKIATDPAAEALESGEIELQH